MHAMDASREHPLRATKKMRAELLKFGDVILSSGYEFKDYCVVMATRRGNPARCYSHAALVINPAVWLESTGEGTGLTHFRVTKSGDMGAPAQSFIDVSHYRRIDVFRMTDVDLSRIDPSSAEFGNILDSFVGFEYPVLDELAGTTTWLASWPEMKRRIMAKATRTEVVNPGDFCSELIVNVFDACKKAGLVDVGVLKMDMPSCNISPNDLTDPSMSRLKLMNNFVELGPVPAASHERAAELEKISYDFDPNVWVDIGNRFRSDRVVSKSIEKRLEDVARLLNQQSGDFATATANLVQEKGWRLLYSEDNPYIEDAPGRPEARQIQEDSLRSGLNPGWLRMEGVASRFVRRVHGWRQFIFSTAGKLIAVTDDLNLVPKSKIRSVLLQKKKWLSALPVALEVQASTVDFAREMESDVLRGFESDGEWIDVIKETAAGFLLDIEAFQKYLEEVDHTWGGAEKVTIFNRRALKSSLKDIAHLKTATRQLAQSIHRYVESLDVTGRELRN
jgi:hypothetical protein